PLLVVGFVKSTNVLLRNPLRAVQGRGGSEHPVISARIVGAVGYGRSHYFEASSGKRAVNDLRFVNDVFRVGILPVKIEAGNSRIGFDEQFLVHELRPGCETIQEPASGLDDEGLFWIRKGVFHAKLISI